MTRLGSKFRVDLQPSDASVACVAAIEDMEWHVESVDPHRIVSNSRLGEPRLRIEVLLRESAEGGTLVRVIGSSAAWWSDRERLRGAMFEVRDAIQATAQEVARHEVSLATRRGEPVLEPELREHLSQATAEDRRWARVFRILALALLIMSGVILAEAAVTLLWQEPLSYVYARQKQSELDSELRNVEAEYRRVETHRVSRQTRKTPPSLAVYATRLGNSTRAGEPLGRIRIPAIGLETVMVEDASSASLRKGPAHYDETPLPGQRGTVGIAGHRTTYQAPFHDLDDLEKGNRVVVRMPYGVFRYRVEGSKVVSPDGVQVLDRVGHDRLTLTACHPLYSAAERIAVFARLASADRMSGAQVSE